MASDWQRVCTYVPPVSGFQEPPGRERGSEFNGDEKPPPGGVVPLYWGSVACGRYGEGSF